MPNVKPFTCPCCGNSLPSKELFSFNKDHVTICPSCSASLEPIKNKSFYWGFSLGFIGFIMPAECIKLLFHSSILAFFSGLIGALATILLVALFVKKTTYFKLKYL